MQESIYATTRDALYGWTAERLVRNQTELGQPAYLYLFDHGYPAADEAGLHAFHASELPYVFGTLDRTPPLWPKNPQTPEDIAFSNAMMDYWTSFARTGRPTAAKEPDWPAYGSSRAYMDFRDVPVPSDHLMPGMYELHEAAVCRRKASDKYPGTGTPGLSPRSSPRARARIARNRTGPDQSLSVRKPAAMNLAIRFLTAGKSSERQTPPDRRSMRPVRARVFISAPVTK